MSLHVSGGRPARLWLYVDFLHRLMLSALLLDLGFFFDNCSLIFPFHVDGSQKSGKR